MANGLFKMEKPMIQPRTIAAAGLAVVIIGFSPGCGGGGSSALKGATDAANSAAGQKLIDAAKNQGGALLAGNVMGDPGLTPAAITGFPSGKGDLPMGYFRNWFSTHRNLIYQTVQNLPAGSVLQVTGHSDPLGGEGLAQQLSDARSRFVYDQLLRTGIPGNKLTYKGLGAQNMVNRDFVGAAENRRVTFHVVVGGSDLAGLANRALSGTGVPAVAGDANVEALNKQLQTLTITGFETGKFQMKPSYMNVWRQRADPIIGQMRYSIPAGYTLEVRGHSDPLGGFQKADMLGRKRAEFVFNALRNMGVPAGRMRVVSRAAQELANPNWVGAGENRRVTLQLVPGYGGSGTGNYNLQNYIPGGPGTQGSGQY